MSDEDSEEDCIEDNEDMWKQKIEDDEGVGETLEDAARDKNEVSMKAWHESKTEDIILKQEIDRVALFNQHRKKCSQEHTREHVRCRKNQYHYSLGHRTRGRAEFYSTNM